MVITGGGTGLGRMLADGFLENGAKVIIVGRREEVLEKTVKELQSGSREIFAWVFTLSDL